MKDDLAEIVFRFFLGGGFAGDHCEQFWHAQRCAPFDVVHPAFPLPSIALPTLRGVLKHGFEEAVKACDIPEPCKFPSLDSCQKGFMWTHMEADIVPHPVIGLVLQAGDAEKFPQAFGFKNLDPFFFQNQQAGSTFHFCIIYGAKHNYITLSCKDTSTHQSTQSGNTTKQQINILFVFFSPIFINNVKNHTKLAA